jgi:AAA domain
VNENAWPGPDHDADPTEEVSPKPRSGQGPKDPPPGDAKKAAFKPTLYEWRNPSLIPPREFVYGRHYARKYLAATVAPGGIGKTSLTIVNVMAMVSGHNLIGDEPHRPIRVWYWNGEDPREEIERRIAATCIHYMIGPDDIGDRLFFDSGRDTEIIIASQTKSGALIATPVETALTAALIDGKFDVLILDPFVSTHRVSENDNMAIDAVAKTLGRIAENANCAIELIHHVRKTNGAEITAEDGRGASAMVAAARSVRVLNNMSKDEAVKAGIDVDRRRFFFRSDLGKANLAPPSEKAAWYNLASVPLGNGDPPDDGDIVGVVTTWEWPNAFEGVTVMDLRAVQAEVRKGRGRENSQAKDWVGIAVARVLKLDPKDKTAKAKIRSLMKTWIEKGMFAVVMVPDENSVPRPYIEAGRPASDEGD